MCRFYLAHQLRAYLKGRLDDLGWRQRVSGRPPSDTAQTLKRALQVGARQDPVKDLQVEIALDDLNTASSQIGGERW